MQALIISIGLFCISLKKISIIYVEANRTEYSRSLIIEDNTTIFRWSLKIGDPTFSGWLIAFLYVAAAIICFKIFMTTKKEETKSELTKVWFCLGLFFIAMGFNKQLDLQTIISDTGRYIATSLDMMEQRHVFKRVFMAVFALGLSCFFYIFRIIIKDFAQRHPLLSGGSCLIILFVFCRALSFHIFSIPFNEDLARLHIYTLWEIFGLCIILFALLKHAKQRRSCIPQD